MIDLHCHLLPGFDDGPDDWPIALKMCQRAFRDGISGVVATPHFFRGLFPTPAIADVHAALLKLQKRCDEIFEGPFQIYLGADCHLHAEVVENVQAGAIPTINGTRYLLLELPDRGLPPGLKDLTFRMSMEGITPIITHPERNAVLQSHPSVLHELIGGGAYAQVTAQSFTGFFGTRARAAAEFMTGHHLVQVIASDGHDVDRRPPVLSEGREAAAEIVGEELSRKMVLDVPRAILANEPIRFPEPIEPQRENKKRTGLWGRILGS